MKQHITPKQLAEIDKARIQELLQVTSTIERNNYYEFHCSKMTIGKMIEILEFKFPTIYIENQLPAGLRDSIRYRVFQQGAGHHYGDNLCDALWNAVKDVL